MTYLEKGKRTYNPEEWPFPVAAEFSDLTERPDFAVEFRRKFPGIKFNSFVIADGNILIQDYTPNLTAETNRRATCLIKKELNTPESLITFQVVDGLTATQNLVATLPQKRWDNTLILFPGNGALSVRKYLRVIEPKLSEGLFVSTQRRMIGKGKFEVSVDLPNNLPKSFSDILVIDDVVASGQTAETVAASLAKKLGILPPINLASWVVLNNRDSYYPAGLPYFKSLSASFIVKGNGVSKPPINSLSCLLGGAERYDRIKREYVVRYLKNEKALNKIKEAVRVASEGGLT